MSAYLTHYTKDGERWDTLAHRFYASVAMQSVLISANRHLFAGRAVPPVLPAGVTLRVPIIERSAVVDPSLLPPWKR